METIEIQLDEQTLNRARTLAQAQSRTLEELIKEFIEQLGTVKRKNDMVLGMFADEPELIDEALESAMRGREEHPFEAG
jgi:hypothetical protein